MISQQRIDELLFSEPNMVRIIRQVEQEATAELRERYEYANLRIVELMGDVSDLRDERGPLLEVANGFRTDNAALRALLTQVRHHAPLPKGLEDAIDAKLREGK